MDKCPCEQDVAVLNKIVEKHDKQLNGNGKDGLVIEVDRLINSFNDMHKDLAKIASANKSLATSQIERDAIEREKLKQASKRTRAWGIVGIAITSGGTLLGGIKMILNFLSS